MPGCSEILDESVAIGKRSSTLFEMRCCATQIGTGGHNHVVGNIVEPSSSQSEVPNVRAQACHSGIGLHVFQANLRDSKNPVARSSPKVEHELLYNLREVRRKLQISWRDLPV
jgi:hypothetical protein